MLCCRFITPPGLVVFSVVGPGTGSLRAGDCAAMLTGPSATRRTLNAYLPSTLDAMSAPGIADRTGIRKSCKSLEVVVNVLNDYCEAANALVAIQKKLAKAVREAASAKSINDIACKFSYCRCISEFAGNPHPISKCPDLQCSCAGGSIRGR